MAANSSLNESVVLTLEQQVDLLTSQRDILTRVERLLIRLIEIQPGPTPVQRDTSQAPAESFFSKKR